MMKLIITAWSIAFFSIIPSGSSYIRSNDFKYTDEALADEITNMPNLNYDPGFRQFSGYLHIENSQKNIFYWYVESQSDPENDPLAYWTNGGPGCSGLIGFGTEMGPFNFRMNETIEENPYSWNKISNMLFVEQPAGVGFSYSNDPTDYETDDKQAALDQYELILAFFRKFPGKKLNDFYITSESYGGHYIPQLALTILEKDVDKEINFKGFAVGNPWVYAPFDDPAMYEMYHSRSLVPRPLYDKWLKYDCNIFENRTDAVCELIEAQMIYDVGYDINPYAIDYPICVEENGVQNNNLWSSQGAQLLLFKNPNLQLYVDNYEPCAADYFSEYLNRNDVQKALHVTANPSTGWGFCNNYINTNWDINDFYASQVDNYNELLSGDYGLKMLVFSGDDDGVCPTEGTQQWIFNLLNVKPMSEFYWLPWHVNDQTAGYATKFNTTYENNSSFMFITVHGAGHEVPAYKPAEAFDLWERYLTDSWVLTVDSNFDSFDGDDSEAII